MNSGLRKLALSALGIALAWGTGSYAEEAQKHSFNTNPQRAERYENSVHLQETLEFLGADCLEVKISGSSQKEDVLSIYNANHKRIANFTGKVNTSLPLFDNKIIVEFRSDSYATDKGFQVNLLEKNIDRCLPEIRQKFLETAQDILHNGANEITESLNTPQSHLSNLHNELSQSANLEAVLPNLIKSFQELASYYQKAADKAAQVKSTLEDRQRALQELQQQVTDIIERLGKGQAEYASLAERDQLLESRTESKDQQKKLSISASAYQKLALNVATRKKVWEGLHQLQYEALKPIPLYLENVQVLLHFMHSNVLVYQEAASLTVLRNQRLAGFHTNLEALKQAHLIISQQETLLRDALENLRREYEVTDKSR